MIMSTIDMVFSLRQLQEKCREQGRPLYIAFIDLTKAFNIVSWKGLFTLLQKARNRPVRWLNLKPMANQERSDGCILVHTEGDLRQLTSSFAHACGEFGIKISLKKTKILCQDVSSTLSSGGGLHLPRLRHFQQPLPRH